MISLDDVEVVVLDLDDTLYLERHYVRSGFHAVSDRLLAAGVTAGFFDAAWALFEAGRRGDVFNAALERLGVPSSREMIVDLVGAYRAHTPRIALCPDAARFLGRMAGAAPLALITDGPVASQSAKIAALGLKGRIDLPILTDGWGEQFRKPHARAFEAVEARWPSVSPSHMVYIADNPRKDFVTPKARGWRTIRMRRPEGEHAATAGAGEHAADGIVATFDDLRGRGGS